MISWIKEFTPTEWPEGVLDNMEPRLFNDGLFPLRQLSGIPMWPSSLERAHVREDGGSRHSTMGGTRLSDATDMHVRTYAQMMSVYMHAQRIEGIGGAGVYFNTNTPMFHIDMRPQRVLWHCTKEGRYIYLSESSTMQELCKFYHSLANELTRVAS